MAVGEGVGIPCIATEFFVGEAAHQEPGGAVAPVTMAGGLAVAQFDGIDVLVGNGQGGVEVGIHRQGVFTEFKGDGAGEHDDYQHGDQNCGDEPCPLAAGNAVGFGFPACGLLLLVEPPGIDGRGEGQGEDGDKHHHKAPDRRQEAQGQHQNAAEAPDLTGETVGGVPVLVIRQGPGSFDAHGGVAAELGHEVADDDEQNAHGCEDNFGHVDLQPQTADIHGGHDGVGQYGDDPQDDLHGLVVLVVIFIGDVGNEDAEPVHGQHQQGNEENGEAPACTAVSFTGGVPVDVHGSGELIPERKAHGDGQQDEQAGDQQNFSVFFQHNQSPFSCVIHSMISSSTEALSS